MSEKKKEPKPTRRRRGSKESAGRHDEDLPPVLSQGQVKRTKRLLLAALRVWEIKRGKRD